MMMMMNLTLYCHSKTNAEFEDDIDYFAKLTIKGDDVAISKVSPTLRITFNRSILVLSQTD